MSNITLLSTRAYVGTQNRFALRSEAGQATSEYGVVVLVAIALALAVAALFTGGKFDDILKSLVGKALETATGMIKKP